MWLGDAHSSSKIPVKPVWDHCIEWDKSVFPKGPNTMGSGEHHNDDKGKKVYLGPSFCQHWDIFPKSTLKSSLPIPLIAPSLFLKGAV